MLHNRKGRTIDLAKPETYQAHCQNGLLLNANECSLEPDAALMEEIVSAIAQMPLHRYPDDEAAALRSKYGALYGLDKEQVLAGNGSDQLLQLLITALGKEGHPILTIDPDFSMYDFYASCLRLDMKKLQTGRYGEFDWKEAARMAKALQPSLVLFSNPNNPTGFLLPSEEVKKLADAIAPIPFAVDEAYMEFADDSAIRLLDVCKNLYVTRTLSKAWGLAGARIGFVLSSEENIKKLLPWKIVYSVSSLDQAAALAVLDHPQKAMDWVKMVQDERQKMMDALGQFDCIEAVPSQANFVSLYSNQAEQIGAFLAGRNIQIRRFPGSDRLRITIGTPQENAVLLEALEDFAKSGKDSVRDVKTEGEKGEKHD